MPRCILGLIVFGALTAAPAIASAQAARGPSAPGGAIRAQESTASTPSAEPALIAERQRLRTELDRVNGEIDALKRDGRGLRDDYRLRNRMADAEALARRLTEVDARLLATGGGPGARRDAATGWPAAPQAQPSDDRTALEAKADILTDQARRLNGQIDVLAHRVADLRGRQELRRRAGQLEHDPFSQMEQAKRRLAASGPAGFAAPSPSTKDVASGTPGRGEQIPALGAAGPPMTVGGGGPTASVPTGAGSTAAGSVDKAQPSLVTPGAAGAGSDSGAAPVATQFREILDAATLAEIRRLELGSTPGGSVAALDRALSALRERASKLTASANALRSRAQLAP